MNNDKQNKSKRPSSNNKKKKGRSNNKKNPLKADTDEGNSPEALKKKMEFSSTFRFPPGMSATMHFDPILRNTFLGGINSIQREAHLRGVPLLEKDGFLIGCDRCNFIVWHTTTLPREKFSWKDHLVKNVIQSSLYHVAVKVLQHQFDPTLKSLREKFVASVESGDVTPLLGPDQNMKLSHVERFWLLPYILLSQSDDEHSKYREKLIDPAEPEMMEKAYNDYMRYNTHLDAIIPECFHPLPDEESDKPENNITRFPRNN